MSYSASYVQERLKNELINYIKSQYFGKNPLLMQAIKDKLGAEGLLFQKPYIESSPAYKIDKNGFEKSGLDPWLKDFFLRLSKANLGIYPSPYTHQIKALEEFINGKDIFVATGTGSGKTECFMWPMLAKMANEAKNHADSWEKRGIRTIILYPMNALVSDQVSRLRKLLGDHDEKFAAIFRNVCGAQSRRPQFGMYTGRTPYPGENNTNENKALAKTLSHFLADSDDASNQYLEWLQKEGKMPSKHNLTDFIDKLKQNQHYTNPEDAELITRFEMQSLSPDILITNYSMLEYMLIRPIEGKIWKDTKSWLNFSPSNRLLFIIDEAHMYRGSAGGEVALLLRRLFHKLGIGRNRVQFILTTASMPQKNKEDITSIKTFFNNLTASESSEFVYITGDRKDSSKFASQEIPKEKFLAFDLEDFDSSEKNKFNALKTFWDGISGNHQSFTTLQDISSWMYDNLTTFKPFNKLLTLCRGSAVSLNELAQNIFPDYSHEEQLKAVNTLLTIAPLAKNEKGLILFPARMHMLFRGLKGVYACVNENCPHHVSKDRFTLGEVLLSDDKLICPTCHSPVYELYNDRRCGALFYKGYILENDLDKKRAYLWHYPGQLIDQRMKAIYLFIPPEGYNRRAKKNQAYQIKPCYMDCKSGYLYFDDSKAGCEGYRKLYYSEYVENGKPKEFVFKTCPHCEHALMHTQFTSFQTKGNQAFNNLIETQFDLESPVPGKSQDRYPNEGRKVLLFSDSRQRAAKLARDMSETSEAEVIRQLFILAIKMMQTNKDLSLDDLYGFFCLVCNSKHLNLFSGKENSDFKRHVEYEQINKERCKKRNKDYVPKKKSNNAIFTFQCYLLRLFSGGYNTFYDTAMAWLMPQESICDDTVFDIHEVIPGITESDFIELFNAWLLKIFDSSTALGHTISNECRLEIRPSYGKEYGLKEDWEFSNVIKSLMGWKKNSEEQKKIRDIFTRNFLEEGPGGKLFVKLDAVTPYFDPNHIWYRCKQCAEITPYRLKGCCPFCGSDQIHELDATDKEALKFWNKPIERALNGEKIQLINTEEHTAQLSHKDQRDRLWSKTEEYELRFQDLIKEDEKPVDILSSTTTMEVGIDIGSLVAVGLRNIPPMRENYQQRAGRAGRRGASLSTIVTYCEDGPHDTMYFENPEPMFRGDPRRPWIDIMSEKLIYRHLNLIALEDFCFTKGQSLDKLPTSEFINSYLEEFFSFLNIFSLPKNSILLPRGFNFNITKFRNELKEEVTELETHLKKHPELYDQNIGQNRSSKKSLLDALYEMGTIPTYMFPKNVVSTYISDANGKVNYEVSRGLDVAINEYAPGRSVVVDKQTYQIGGLYYPGSEYRPKSYTSPAKAFLEDNNYVKGIKRCPDCGWFGLASDDYKKCPFCGNPNLVDDLPMVRPWGFAPKNGEPIHVAQLEEEYSAVGQPIYSTVPDENDVKKVPGIKWMNSAVRQNQRIIMINKGVDNQSGFMICEDCGAIMPGNDEKALKNVNRPYHINKNRPCHHMSTKNIDLGFDFITDMLVLEIPLNPSLINVDRKRNLWLNRAAQSLSEAIRLVACQELDVEFTELVTGYRVRNTNNSTSIDLYLYDALSSGAGYAIEVGANIAHLIDLVEKKLESCTCESACSKCLKHYRNQQIHGLLDRFAALDLLRWAKYGKLPDAIPIKRQLELLDPVKNILEDAKITLEIKGNKLYRVDHDTKKELIVYPAMWKKPKNPEIVYVSDIYLKYAKPYAVDMISNQ
ncbi:MAG: DEAD/DEAH box helicase [Acidaminococcus sp.]|jgi:ATP-dependent helicase YprA (DUF1998 family)/RNA polymerase subunit RPABC4/transcription elongation factor Spt4|nr:DEAD/DEAH box helicase [Acidaminococcus sp.]MCI2099653.1 DEAD/DEAH box helicase [Acidaminococcus sp.]MCI2113942.1 DEAD/DEAH box helicase [Acidaminococcus sp.]MCI2115821.1 DEAD/DEAH box helicase [Acidaminococcus sp.]